MNQRVSLTRMMVSVKKLQDQMVTYSYESDMRRSEATAFYMLLNTALSILRNRLDEVKK